MAISYELLLIAISVHDSPTMWNIRWTLALGSNIATDDQTQLVNTAEGYFGTEMAKLAIPGTFLIYDGKSVSYILLKSCTLACECRVVSIQEMEIR
jgi:flavin reductase (DIM6/NTAB) family NADH-FMN oxidoreductase RutF